MSLEGMLVKTDEEKEFASMLNRGDHSFFSGLIWLLMFKALIFIGSTVGENE